MAKPEWGQKRLCTSCGTKFYDLRKAIPACPSCGATVDLDAPTKRKSSRGKHPTPSKAKSAAATSIEEPAVSDDTDAAPLDVDSSYDETSEELDEDSTITEDGVFTNAVDDDEQEDN
jgi:uncharacterized protein (TIGR02300 family)